MASIVVHYAELRGDRAQDTLRAYLRALPDQAGFLGAELLSSPEQPGLALVASRWAGTVPGDLPIPEGAKAWAFAVAESTSSDTDSDGKAYL